MQAILLVTVFSCLLAAANAGAVTFGATCGSGDTCSDAHTECSGTPPKCVCVSGFTAVSGVCTANGGLGTDCLSATPACSSDTLVCESSVCKTKVGQTCTAPTTHCVAHSTCSASKCECDKNYNAGPNGLCTQAAAPGTGPGSGAGAGAGETCVDDHSCAGANFACVGRKCECKAGFTLSGNSCNGGGRLSVSSWFLAGSIIMLLMTLSLP